MSRPNFNYFCRHCGTKQSCDGRNLLTNYVACINCSQKFRICDADHRAESRLRKFDRALTHIFDQFNFFGVGIGDGFVLGGVDDEAGRFDTECVHCHAPIRTYCTVNPDGSIPVPYACRSCGRKLPGPWSDDPPPKPKKSAALIEAEEETEFLAEGLQAKIAELAVAEFEILDLKKEISKLEKMNLATERRYEEHMKTTEEQTKQLLQELQTAKKQVETLEKKLASQEKTLADEQNPVIKAFSSLDPENSVAYCKKLYQRAVMLNGTELNDEQFCKLLERLHRVA